MIEPLISPDAALLFLNLETLTASEMVQLNFLIDQITAVILSYCGQDPRADPEEECAVLEFIAGRMLLQLRPHIVNQTTGIESQSFESMSIKFAPDCGIDNLSRQLLSRFRVMSIG